MVFLALLALVLIGYGVAMHAILQPYRSFDQGSVQTIARVNMFIWCSKSV